MNIGTKIVVKFWLITSSSVLCRKSRTQSGALHMHLFHYIHAHLTTDEIQFIIVLKNFNFRLKNVLIQCERSFIQIWMYQKKPKMKNTGMFEKIRNGEVIINLIKFDKISAIHNFVSTLCVFYNPCLDQA